MSHCVMNNITHRRQGLLEAMEQQQVSIAKAGIIASLSARCSVLAAANPKHGSYNMSKTVAENLNMAKPILSRFDLVFILRDRANAQLDRLVSDNIMNLHRKTGGGTDHSNPVATTQHETDYAPAKASGRVPLSDRLRWVNSFQKQALPADLVRDYIAYAREYCKPKLTPEASAVLKDYYMKLRYPVGAKAAAETVPITTRQLEALIRLCQARAKACLREFVLEEDALDVVELMGLSVEQVHSDESGALDRSRGGAGGQSNRKMKKAFVAELHRVIGISADCTIEDLRRIAETVNCGLSEFHGLIEDIRNAGVLLKKSGGTFRISS
jgi:DNA helicase MCM8